MPFIMQEKPVAPFHGRSLKLARNANVVIQQKQVNLLQLLQNSNKTSMSVVEDTKVQKLVQELKDHQIKRVEPFAVTPYKGYEIGD